MGVFLLANASRRTMAQQESQSSDDRSADAEQMKPNHDADVGGGSEAHLADQPQTESLLRQVLDETIAESAEPLAPAELEALRDVARRHQRDAFEIEPVGVALVESILTLRVPEYQTAEKKWRDMSRQIAEILFDSPAAVARLERLWNRLCASTS
jgi:hypothetical protein